MPHDVIFDVESRLNALPEGGGQSVAGASSHEIDELESELGHGLPRTYRRFLERMGHSAGGLFRGSDYSLAQPHRLRLRPAAERVIARAGGGHELPVDAFVFLIHHGYQFLFMRLGEGDDPPVYRFSDADHQAVRIADTFSEFLSRRLANHEELVHRQQAGMAKLERAVT